MLLRLLFTLCAVLQALAVLPAQAAAPVYEQPILPEIIQDALLDAAATGNPLVVDAVADRLGRLFPATRTAIALYVANIAQPASHIAFVVNEMIIETPKSFAFYQSDAVFYPERTEEYTDAMAMAAELNDLDVGAGL